ncbi:sulfite exporter TauE/SafE family protein, partial [Staphylococcus aureus]
MLFITILAVGAAIGLIISTTGVGGGVIVLPILTYFFGMNA